MSNIDEEDDYLSASFIPGSSLDVRPGLNFTASRKRKHEMEKKNEFLNQRNRTKPVRVLEIERREEALKKEIEPDNKGFAMMQRMGYKPGTAIGKKEGKAQEPISISLKNDRSGLGKKEEEERLVKCKMEREIENHKKKVENSQQLLVEYQEKVRKERTNKRILSDFMKSQKACEQLDGQCGITEPKESWYWRKQKGTENEDDDDDEAGESDEDEEKDNFEEKLLILTSYLRSNFKYCLWCGVKFDDSEDLDSNCPGNTYDDHE